MSQKKNKNEEATPRMVTANQLTNVKDIKGHFLYTKDGFIIVYLRVHPYNLDLVSKPERQAKTEALTAAFLSDRKNFDYLSIPRELDLDEYKNFLNKAYQNEQDSKHSLGRRGILRIMMKEAHMLSTSGENYEHQHFLKLWAYLGSNPQEAKHSLLERADEFRQRYDAAGIKCTLLEEGDIIKMCNLFGNSIQAAYENYDNAAYIPLALLKE